VTRARTFKRERLETLMRIQNALAPETRKRARKNGNAFLIEGPISNRIRFMLVPFGACGQSRVMAHAMHLSRLDGTIGHLSISTNALFSTKCCRSICLHFSTAWSSVFWLNRQDRRMELPA